MKKFFVALTIAILTLTNGSEVFAEDATCVMIKFSNDTRYKNVDTASVLSDLVVERLLASGKINLTETKPLDANLESQLYLIKSRELANAASAMNSKNLSVLFEGAGFNSKQAQTIGTADVGQIISPSITSQIGKLHNAGYLIQGNIIALGNGAWENSDANTAMGFAKLAGRLAEVDLPLPNVEQKVAGIGVKTDLRIIKADTGEVVWRKIVVGKKTTKLTSVGGFKFGSAKLTSELYTQALEDAVNQIVDALTNDLTAYKLILQ